MIQYLDNALGALLKKELPSDLAKQLEISFATPDEIFAEGQAKRINLFLYDVRENRELRSNEWRLERRGKQAFKKPPAVRVDCSYLVTAWPSKKTGGPTPAAEEHYMLGEVMRVLLRHPTIPGGLLEENLQGQEPPLPAISLRPGPLQSPGELWQALGGQLKAALHYTVTIGVEAQEEVEAGQPVTRRGPAGSSGSGRART